MSERADKPHAVRYELFFSREGDKYPTEKAWTAEGTWFFPRFFLGRWSDRSRSEEMTLEEARVKGFISRDELRLDVIGTIEREFGWKPNPEQQISIRTAYDQMPDHFGREGQLTPELFIEIDKIAREAVDWANEHHAPVGRKFVLEDSLYLIQTAAG